ncbi:MAG: hypothetical protein JNM70_22980 [Anaerolineae bacterium]|nr:hypothetical protein [Anaerolineae bacterium]
MGNDKNDKNENARILRIVRNVVQVVHAGRTNWHKWRQRQNGNFVPKSSHVSSFLPEMLQMLQVQIGEKLQMLQLLQLQLREICNNAGMRNSRFIGCEGASAGIPDAP